jgi:excisionase family DNA binding protein
MSGDDEILILTVKEVSEIFRIHPSTLYRLLKQGEIPSFRTGGEWRFRNDQIERWIAERTLLRDSLYQ